MNHKSWREEMKNPENVDELAGLFVSLTGFHGGAFCIDYKTFIKEYPFMANEESINSLIIKLRVNSIFIRNITKISTLNNLESGPRILVVREINL